MGKTYIENILKDHIAIQRAMLEDTALTDEVLRCAELLTNRLFDGGKVLICGNGGSAADAQHMAAELVGRFEREREGLFALALSADTSILTAVANDYGYTEVFRRQVAALGRPGDILIGISTSGNSENIVSAFSEAKMKGIQTIGFWGGDGGILKNMSDCCLVVPSKNTARIQEAHITLIHILCGLIERKWADE